jgi:hypothetical protein
MRGKLPYDSGKRGSSIGSRKRVGLSGETADFFSSFTTFFYLPRRLLVLVVPQAI